MYPLFRINAQSGGGLINRKGLRTRTLSPNPPDERRCETSASDGFNLIGISPTVFHI